MPEPRTAGGVSKKARKRKAGVSEEAQPAQPSAKRPAKAQQQASGEVDALFGKLIQHKKGAGAKEGVPAKAKQAATGAAPSAKKAAKRPLGSKDDIFGREEAKAKRRTADGLALYSEAEFRAAFKTEQGGDTAQCPFDCQCCFS